MRALLILTLLAGAARADSPLEEEAKRHYFAGKKHFDAGQYAEALAEYQKSYELTHYPGLAYNLGLCYEQLARYPEALDAFDTYLKAEPATPRRANVESRMQVMRTLQAAQKPVEPRPVEPPPEPKPVEPPPESKPAPVVTPIVSAPIVAQPVRTPVHRRWWVWTLAGVAAAGVALGVGLGVGLATPSFDTNLPAFGRVPK